MPSAHLIRDIEVKHRIPQKVLLSPRLGLLLKARAEEVAVLYQARVAKKTGRLAASAHAKVEIGGHKHDRLVGKVVVGGRDADYGVLHEFGSPTSPSFRGSHELAEAVARWKGHR